MTVREDRLKLEMKKAEILFDLSRLIGITGAAIYLLGGHSRFLEQELSDFDLALGALKDHLLKIHDAVETL